LADGLTVLAAYCAAGRPDMRLKPWGSYEGWSALIRSAIVWAGLPDPGETRQDLTGRADGEANALTALIEYWSQVDPTGRGVTAGGLLRDLATFTPPYAEDFRAALLEFCPGSYGRLPSPNKLGKRLRAAAGRNIGGRCLDSRVSQGRQLWSVRTVARPAGGGSGDSGGGSGGIPTTDISHDDDWVNDDSGGSGDSGGSVSPRMRAHARVCAHARGVRENTVTTPTTDVSDHGDAWEGPET
jgi:hypothetical protein